MRWRRSARHRHPWACSARRIAVVDGALRTQSGTLAGAHLDLATAARNAVAMLGASPEEALRMAGLTPANFSAPTHDTAASHQAPALIWCCSATRSMLAGSGSAARKSFSRREVRRAQFWRFPPQRLDQRLRVGNAQGHAVTRTAPASHRSRCLASASAAIAGSHSQSNRTTISLGALAQLRIGRTHIDHQAAIHPPQLTMTAVEKRFSAIFWAVPAFSARRAGDGSAPVSIRDRMIGLLR